jgi:hypothetical protein
MSEKKADIDTDADPQIDVSRGLLIRQPETDQTIDTTADIEAQQQRKEARKRAIRQYMDRGYKSGKEQRPIRSPAHAEFMCRAGLIDLP